MKIGAWGLVLGRRWRHAGPGSADDALAYSAFQRRSEPGARCRRRDVIARRRAQPEGALTSHWGLRDNVAATTGWGARQGSARGLPGEAGDWRRAGGQRLEVPGVVSHLVPRLQGLNALAEEAAPQAAKPESVASAGEVARVALGGAATGSPNARP